MATKNWGAAATMERAALDGPLRFALDSVVLAAAAALDSGSVAADAASANAALLSRLPPDAGIDIFVEAFHPLAGAALAQALMTVAEPIARPPLVHRYRVSLFTVGPAAARGVSGIAAAAALRGFSGAAQRDDAALWAAIGRFLRAAVGAHGQARVAFGPGGACVVECVSEALARRLRADRTVATQAVGPVFTADEEEGQAPRLAAAAATSVAATAGMSGVINVDDDGDGDGDATESAADAAFGEAVQVAPDSREAAPTAAAGVVVRRRWAFRLCDAAAAMYVSQRALAMGVPIARRYDFVADATLRTTDVVLRAATRPRAYQRDAVAAAVSGGHCASGVIVLPCGAGKTLVGVLLAACVRKPTMIVCASALSVEQWHSQLLTFATVTDSLPPPAAAAPNVSADATNQQQQGAGKPRPYGNKRNDKIACITGKHKDPVTDRTDVVITTYAMLVAALRTWQDATRAAAARAEQRQGRQPRSASGVGDARNVSNVVGVGVPGDAAGGPPLPSSAATSSARESKLALLRRTWGLLLLDEAHTVPAASVEEALAFVRAKAVVGLTATYVREDGRISRLLHSVGPKLFDVSWQLLCSQGYLAKVTCVEVHCPMAPEFASEYAARQVTRTANSGDTEALGAVDASRPRKRQRGRAGDSDSGDDSGGSDDSDRPPRSSRGATVKKNSVQPKQQPSGNPSFVGPSMVLLALAAANPIKFECVAELVARHAARKDKILVFCDYISLLIEYSRRLRCPVIHGGTSHSDRMKIFSDFQATNTLNVVCVSRVGDVSVNLPAASVVIEVTSHGGSRRQESQRLGRILRPKDRTRDGGTVEAAFYALVSSGTAETEYAGKRARYLVDQGYTCRVATFPFVENSAGAAAAGHRTDVAAPGSWGGAAAAPAAAAGGNVAARVGTAGAAPMVVADLATPRGRVEWLASVVARWEWGDIGGEASGGSGRRRGTADGSSDSDGSAGSESGDERVEGIVVKTDAAPEATLAALLGATGIPTAAAAGVNGCAGDGALAFSHLTAGADDLVYHEF